jgi:HEAT repeat protein
LRKAASDSLPEVRVHAIRALGDLRAAEAVPELLAAAGDPRTRTVAFQALTRLGPDATPALTAALEGTDGATRVVVAKAISRQSRNPKAGVALRTLLADDDPQVREVAAAALAQNGPAAADALNGLIEASRDEDPETRTHVVRALGSAGKPTAAVVAVLALRCEEVGEVGPAAAEALALLAPRVPEAVPALTRALSGGTSAAGRALVRQAGPTALVPALHAGGKARLAALAALSLFDGTLGEAREVVRKLLDSEDASVRSVAASAFARHATEAGPAVGRLTALLADADAEVRRSAASALGRVGGSTADLCKLRRDPSRAVREAAWEALSAR